MIVLLFSVMAGLATLARGVLFTVAACLVLVASVSVLYNSLQFVGTLGGPGWIPGVLAILAFVLVIGGPAYVLAIREGSAPGGESADQDRADDRAPSDPEPGAREGATDEQVPAEVDDHSDAEVDDHSDAEVDDHPDAEVDDHPDAEVDDHPDAEVDDHPDADDHDHSEADDHDHSEADDHDHSEADDHDHSEAGDEPTDITDPEDDRPGTPGG